MKVCAVLLAAGRSERFGEDKLWIPIEGQPLWFKSYQTLRNCPGVDSVGIVAQSGRLEEFRRLAPDAEFVVEGGTTRQASSYAGARAVPDHFDIVLIHDAARAFVTHDVVARVIEGVKFHGAAFPGIPLTDTIKEKCDSRWITPEFVARRFDTMFYVCVLPGMEGDAEPWRRRPPRHGRSAQGGLAESHDP